MIAALLATEAGAGFELPPIDHLFDFEAMFAEGTLFAFNRTAFLYLLAAAIVSALAIAGLGNSKVVPGKLQAAMEAVVEFIRDGIIQPIIGPEGVRYLPLLVTMFLFILVNNLFEVVPFINFPTTSRMAVPAMLSLMVYVLFILVGVKAQGGFRYLWNSVSVPGVHWAMLLLIVPIEFVSTFLLRPFTLAVRLFANMMAGHILLTVVFLASSYNFIDFHSLYDGLGTIVVAPQGFVPFILGIFIVIGGAALVAFEILVASLQAYIFTMLAAVYIGGSMSPSH